MMNIVFEETKKTLTHGKNAVVCTIIKSDGSSPRKTGADMIVTASGKSYGSIGGGDLERFCIAKASEIHVSHQPLMKEFNLDASAKDDVSMICGGNVTVKFDFFDSEKYNPKDLEEYFSITSVLDRVFIFGGGHVGGELVPVLEHLGFQVTLIDDRPEFSKAERHPKAYKTILGDYSDISKYVNINTDDYVVIMTHGHLGDRQILLQALKTPATYIGCIGSRRKIAATNAFLMENGIPEDQLKRVHSPIGIELFGDTPQEIAISVAAELIRHRAIKAGLNK